MKKFFIVITLLVLISGCVRDNVNYEIYPDTDEAPLLELYWDGELEPENIERITPYGVWEGAEGVWEPAVEMQFYTYSHHNPVYAPASGIVTSVDNQWASITVRHGRKYGYTMHHIVDITVNVGDRVEQGDLIGYTELRAGLGWWEVELNVHREGNVYRSIPPYDYFSPESKEVLDMILNSTRYRDYTSWTVREGEESWIAEIGSDEWWCSAWRLGYFSAEEESLHDFLVSVNMTHVESSYL